MTLDWSDIKVYLQFYKNPGFRHISNLTDLRIMINTFQYILFFIFRQNASHFQTPFFLYIQSFIYHNVKKNVVLQ